MTDLMANKWNRVGFLQTEQPADEQALQRAIRLCQESQAELSLMAIPEEMPEGLHRLMATLGMASADYSDQQTKQAALVQAVEQAQQRNVVATSQLLQSRPLEGIVREALTQDFNVLLKAAQPTHGIRQVLLGHLDRQLIRQCPCPVWIEKPSSSPSHDMILAAVDPTPFVQDADGESQSQETNINILRWATHLAELEQAQLHVVHVWPFYHERRLHRFGGFSSDEVSSFGEAVRQQHETALNELIEPFSSKIQRVHLLKGNAAEEISRLADRLRFDVVVMGTACRSGIQGMLIGNTAETVLDQIDCSIVAIKPPGFVSPVASN